MGWPPWVGVRVPSPHGLTPSLPAAIGLLASTTTVLLGGIRASSRLFRRLLWDVARSPIGFFERTPMGNLLNRFSKETDTVDVDIPDKLRSLLIYTFGLLEVSLVVTVATPLAAVAVLPLLLLYTWFQVGRGWEGSWGQLRSPQPVPCLRAGVRETGSVPLGSGGPPLKTSQRQDTSLLLTPVLTCVSQMFISKFVTANILSCCC